MVEQVARETKISFLPCLSDCWITSFNCGPGSAWTSCFSKNMVSQSGEATWRSFIFWGGFALPATHWCGLRLLCSSNHWCSAILLFFCYSVFKYPSWVRTSVLIQLQLCLLTARVVTKGGLGLGNSSLTGMKASLPTRFSLAWSLYFSAD